jgi:putative transposase
LGINRKRIYYQGCRENLDLITKQQIENTHKTHPAYGHKRLAMALKANKKKILRVMHKYGIKPPRRKSRRIWLTESVSNHHYTNLIKDLVPIGPEQIWVSDLTYLEYRGKFFYLETVEDIFTREVVGAAMSDQHDSVLALSAIREAVHSTASSPEFFHFDQGRENLAQTVTSFLEGWGIKVSVSDKGSPWQNGYKESFFGRFKNEFGDINRFESLGELVEEVYAAIYYYNHLRIHTALKMPPAEFKQQYLNSKL